MEADGDVHGGRRGQHADKQLREAIAVHDAAIHSVREHAHAAMTQQQWQQDKWAQQQQQQ